MWPSLTEFELVGESGRSIQALTAGEPFSVNVAPLDRYGNRTLADDHISASLHWIVNGDDGFDRRSVEGQERRLEQEMEMASRRISKSTIECEAWAQLRRGSLGGALFGGNEGYIYRER